MAQASSMQATSQAGTSRFLALVYLAMAAGLAITALVSTWVSSNPDLIRRILFDPWFVWLIFIIQIVVVVALSAAVTRLSPGVALLLFFFYAALTGMAISSIFIYYSKSTIAYTFWVTAGMFLFSSILGLVIRRDLSAAGRFLLLILMGWIFAWFFSILFPFAAGFNQMLTIGGIFLFAALTVWDTQRLKQLAAQLEGRQGMGGMVILGALTLYLDFINLFLLLLRRSQR